MLIGVRQALHWRLQKFCDRLAAPASDAAPKLSDVDPNAVYESMAAFVQSVRSTTLTASAADGARRCLIDAVACMLAGASADEGKALLARFGATPETLFSADVFASERDHAFLLAALAQVHDFNDGFVSASERGRAFHPGRVIVSAALASSLASKGGRETLLRAIAVGYDLAAFVCDTMSQTPADAYGAAGAVALIKDFDMESTAFALRVAGFMAPYSGSEDFETNNLTIAQQAASGVLAAEMVSSGYPLSRATTRTVELSRFRFEQPATPGDSFELVYLKPYPSCRTTHYAIDAALQLQSQTMSRLDKIVAIEIEVQHHSRGPARTVPAGAYFKSYQFSTAYCVAAVLIDGELGLEQFQAHRTADPVVQGLQSKIEFRFASPDATPRAFAHVTINFDDGTHLTASCTEPLGAPGRPLSDHDLSRKLAHCAQPLKLDADEVLRKLEATEETFAADQPLAHREVA